MNNLHKSIKSRIIIKFLKYNNFSLINDLVVKIFNFCSKGFGRQQIFNNTFVSIKIEVLVVEEDFDFKPFEILLDDVEFLYKNVYFIICDVKKYEYFLNKTNYLFLFRFDYDRIKGNDILRLEMFMNKIKEVVESFFEYGEQIVVGVSGGADSMVLLHALKSSNKNFNLIVAHLNHCLRGEESKRDEKFVYEYCLKNNIEFVCRREDVLKKAKEKKISVEECGREQRYKFFEEFGCTVATAHTLSDVCETFFLNILRGCALKGLLSIPEKRGKIIRSLLTFTREDILDYCKENNLKFVEDSSNFKEIYLRNKLRLFVIPKLKEINENFEHNFLKTLNVVKQDEDFLEYVTTKEFEKAKVSFGLDVNYINKLHKSIKSRIIVKFLKYNNFSLTNDLVVKIFNLCSKGFGRQQIFNNTFVSVKRGILVVEEDFGFKPFKILLDDVEFLYKNLYFIICDIKKYEYFLNKTNYLFLFRFDYDKIEGKVYLKSREEKDSLKLLNRPTKTIKALMQEKGMIKNKKDKVVLLEDDVGVFWAFGFGGNPRVFPDSNTKTLCLIFEKL